MEVTDGADATAALGDAFLAGAASGQYVMEEAGEEDTEQTSDDTLKEQDRFLPIANVARIMKKSVPKTGKIAKEAKECVQECVSEFISFITSEASERCHQEKRKTINGEDILFAMSTLGFDNYVEPLKVYLQEYRESQKSEKGVSQAEASMEDIDGSQDAFASNIAANMLTVDQTGQGQQNVIYTTFPAQMAAQPINYG